MVQAGIGSGDILGMLKLHSTNTRVLRRQINNQRAMVRKNMLAGRTPIVALYEKLSTIEFISAIKAETDGSLSALFFAHNTSALLAKRFCNVFIMDCTYKTNRYGMPLLNIVGITCTYSTFNAAFCFVKEETKDLYEWALNEFQKIVKPPVIVTDRELALINAIKAIFHGTKILL